MRFEQDRNVVVFGVITQFQQPIADEPERLLAALVGRQLIGKDPDERTVELSGQVNEPPGFVQVLGPLYRIGMVQLRGGTQVNDPDTLIGKPLPGFRSLRARAERRAFGQVQLPQQAPELYP